MNLVESGEEFYFVIGEDETANRFSASTPQEAVNRALERWDLAADVGYRLLVFHADRAQVFRLAQHAEADEA